jgi:hypothetical protein
VDSYAQKSCVVVEHALNGDCRNEALECCFKTLPSLLEGKLTSENAIRVPVPNGSLVVLNLEISRETSLSKSILS